MPMKSVKDFDPAKCNNCVFHFPQFERFTESELRASLESAIKDSEVEFNGEYTRSEQYFKYAYKNWRELTAEYKKMMSIPFIEACNALVDLSEAESEAGRSCFISSDLYLDLRGGVAKFRPCCS